MGNFIINEMPSLCHSKILTKYLEIVNVFMFHILDRAALGVL